MESIPAESPPQAPEKEEQPQPGPAAAPTGYLRLRGLPFSVGPGELVDWFSAAGFELVQTFICKRNGKNNDSRAAPRGGTSQTRACFTPYPVHTPRRGPLEQAAAQGRPMFSSRRLLTSLG